ncbi:MAG: molybdopterin molybdotransferase MoeA [Xanthomonadales bacterium]
MLSVNQAIETLLAQAECLVERETLPLLEAHGRVLADNIRAPIDVPPADNSAMDGYALRHADWPGAERGMPLSQRITAGSAPGPLEDGTAARIFTGAEVPAGADTVVMQERCEAGDGSVRILERPARGANIRSRGQDVRLGQDVLAAGRRLRAQDIGLVASLGLDRVTTYRPLRVAVMSTGDELVEPGRSAGPGQIYNSNRFTMHARLSAWGFEVVDLGVARDEPGAVRERLLRGAEQADVVLTSGGVSVGEEDHVRDVIESLGRIDLWRIAVKPGKPFAFGAVGDTPFIGLPGNPVSVFVTLLIIARPFLFACQGRGDLAMTALRAPARFRKNASWREDYLRVRATEDGLVLYDNQSSGALFSTGWADGLARQAADVAVEEGDLVEYFPWALFD